MRKLIILLIVIPAVASAQLKSIVEKAGKSLQNGGGTTEVSAGLKEALNKGVEKQVSKLTLTDGFYKNQAVKILMPSELVQAERTLRKVGLGSLADDAVKSLNRAAEDAVKEATPIFLDAIKGMSIADGRKILMGESNAATLYLQNATTTTLYNKFLPVVQQSMGKVGADKIWNNLITRYNGMPMTSNINPDINDYVTQKALEGVFKMIAEEEKTIRTDLSARTSPILKKIFAMQDKK